MHSVLILNSLKIINTSFPHKREHDLVTETACSDAHKIGNNAEMPNYCKA